MHRNRRVAEHRLRARRRDDDELVRSLDRIFDVPEAALDLDLLHLEVGDRGVQLGIPVDEALVLIDEPGVVELDEHLEDGLRQALVHGEALARPVAACAEPLELIDDDAAGFGLPLPDTLDELLAPHGAAPGLLAFHELTLNHHLGRDAGMVGSRLPQHVAAAHALEAAQHVLERVVERMAHVQRARHVGWRDDDAIGLGVPALGAAGTKGLRLLPGRPHAALDFEQVDKSSRSSRASGIRDCNKPGGACAVNGPASGLSWFASGFDSVWAGRLRRRRASAAAQRGKTEDCRRWEGSWARAAAGFSFGRATPVRSRRGSAARQGPADCRRATS